MLETIKVRKKKEGINQSKVNLLARFCSVKVSKRYTNAAAHCWKNSAPSIWGPKCSSPSEYMELERPCSLNSRSRPCALLAHSARKHIKREAKRETSRTFEPSFSNQIWAYIQLSQRVSVLQIESHTTSIHTLVSQIHRHLLLCEQIHSSFRFWRPVQTFFFSLVSFPILLPLAHWRNQLIPIIDGPIRNNAKP